MSGWMNRSTAVSLANTALLVFEQFLLQFRRHFHGLSETVIKTNLHRLSGGINYRLIQWVRQSVAQVKAFFPDFLHPQGKRQGSVQPDGMNIIAAYVG